MEKQNRVEPDFRSGEVRCPAKEVDLRKRERDGERATMEDGDVVQPDNFRDAAEGEGRTDEEAVHEPLEYGRVQECQSEERRRCEGRCVSLNRGIRRSFIWSPTRGVGCKAAPRVAQLQKRAGRDFVIFHQEPSRSWRRARARAMLQQ